MIPGAAVLGLVYGLLRKGRFNYVLSKSISAIPALFLSFICEYLVSSGWLLRLVGEGPHYVLLRTATAGLQYMLVTLFIILNLRKTEHSSGLLPLLTGSLLNGLVIVANLGRMPVTALSEVFGPADLNRILTTPHYMLADDQGVLLALGDWIPFWFFGWYIVSLGDFFISVGIFLFTAWLTRKSKPDHPKTVEHPNDIVYTDGR